MGLTPIQDQAGTRREALTVLPTHAAGDATISYPVFRAEGAVIIENVNVVYPIAITGADTNTHHINLDTRTAAYATPTEIGNIDHTNGNDATANSVAALYETGTQALTDGMYLTVELEEIGTGGAVALGALGIQVDWRPEE
jgi:hypothetical protein|tara:strand:- start:1129 stop:1551 length:423 start_codon:yes stop_codon:yes gene_type:complete